MPREPFPRELPPLRDDVIALVRGAIGAAIVIAILVFINQALPILRDWLHQ